ncbi:MAG: hypothetical protein ACJ0RQ_15840 [Candidatus Azotimanducaceae bacterium]
MNKVRERVKFNVPAVVLTLLGIVQAFALELLWTFVAAEDALVTFNLEGVFLGLQSLSIFLAILGVWLVYASAVTRFVWVPSFLELVLPFWVGLIQFLLIELMGVKDFPIWLLLTAILFATLHWIGQTTMLKARRDPENASFFDQTSPATWRDFLSVYLITFGMLLGGGLAWALGFSLTAKVGVMIAVIVVLFAQLRQMEIWWTRSVRDE